jgi:hypothetical protein
MTIRKRLLISFSVVLMIVAFIIGVFFYTIYNLNSMNNQENYKYEQLIRVEKLKEFNNSYGWIVLDIITDFEKIQIVNERIKKANELFENLSVQENEIINNSESGEEKKNLVLIFTNFDFMHKLIKEELYNLALHRNGDFSDFSKKFEAININTRRLLEQEIKSLQDRLNQIQNIRNTFLDTIKLELVILFVVLFLLRFVIMTIKINSNM